MAQKHNKQSSVKNFTVNNTEYYYPNNIMTTQDCVYYNLSRLTLFSSFLDQGKFCSLSDFLKRVFSYETAILKYCHKLVLRL